MVMLRIVPYAGFGSNSRSTLEIVLLGESTNSYNAFFCGNSLLGLTSIANFFLRKMNIITNVIIVVAVSVMIKVNTNVIVTAAPIDNEFESDFKET